MPPKRAAQAGGRAAKTAKKQTPTKGQLTLVESMAREVRGRRKLTPKAWLVEQPLDHSFEPRQSRGWAGPWGTWRPASLPV
jgi:hypothetical protein